MAKRTETKVKEKLNIIDSKLKLVGNGGEIEKGYKPDRVYLKGKQIVLVEIETSTDRKKHLGNYLKAHHYIASKPNILNGYILLIVKEWENTKLTDIAAQIEKYKKWLESNGIKPVTTQVITISQVNSAVKSNTGLLTADFKKIGKKL